MIGKSLTADSAPEGLQHLRPLVDSDSFIYSAGFSADVAVAKEFMDNLGCDREKANELAAEEDYLVQALGNVKQLLQDSVRLFDAQSAKFFLTGSGNYRESVATLAPYKGNRDGTHKPRYYKELREYVQSVWKAEVVHGMEADDAVSIEQYSNKDKSTVLVSIDKDLLNTPGHHFNPKRNEYCYITKPEADKNFWIQVATGDPTDNIKGLHKIGIKTALKEWDATGSMERYQDWVKRMYDKQYRDEGPHAMHETATLCWIQRESWVNYDGSSLRG